MVVKKVALIFLLLFICIKAEQLRYDDEDAIFIQDEYVLDDNYGNMAVETIKKGKSERPTKLVLNTKDNDVELVLVESRKDRKSNSKKEVDLLRLLNDPSCKFTSQAARTLNDDATITALTLVCQHNAAGRNNLLIKEHVKLINSLVNEYYRAGHRYRKDNPHFNMLRSRNYVRESQQNEEDNVDEKKGMTVDIDTNYNYDSYKIRNKLKKLLQNQDQNWTNYKTSTDSNYVNPSKDPFVEYDSTPDPQLPTENISYVYPTVPYPADNFPPNPYPINPYPPNPILPNRYHSHPNYYPKYHQYPPNYPYPPNNYPPKPHPANYPFSPNNYPLNPKPYPPNHLPKPVYYPPHPYPPNQYNFNYYDDPFVMETTVYPPPEFYPFDPSYVNHHHNHHRPKFPDFSDSEEEHDPHQRKFVKNRKHQHKSIPYRRRGRFDVKKPRTAKEFRDSPTKKQLILNKK